MLPERENKDCNELTGSSFLSVQLKADDKQLQELLLEKAMGQSENWEKLDKGLNSSCYQ